MQVIVIANELSHGAEKSQQPEVGFEPGPQGLQYSWRQANTLPRRCKSRFYCKAVEVCYLYTYPYYRTINLLRYQSSF